MNTSTKAAGRVVASLAVLKWIAVALWAVTGLLAVGVIWLAESWPQWTVWLEVPAVLVAIVGGWLSWTFIGWRQHMLAQLAVGNDRLANVRLDAARIQEYGVGQPAQNSVFEYGGEVPK